MKISLRRHMAVITVLLAVLGVHQFAHADEPAQAVSADKPIRLFLERQVTSGYGQSGDLVSFIEANAPHCHYVGSITQKPLPENLFSKAWKIADADAAMLTVQLTRRRCDQIVSVVSLDVVFPLRPSYAPYEPGMEVFAVPSTR